MATPLKSVETFHCYRYSIKLNNDWVCGPTTLWTRIGRGLWWRIKWIIRGVILTWQSLIFLGTWEVRC